MSTWLERHQVVLYVLAIAVGALVGMAAPRVGEAAEHVIEPAIGLLLFATFLGVPFSEIGQGFRDVRFLVTLLVVNFAIGPAVVFGLSRFVADDAALLIGVLFVLLTPCIDYVIVFTGLAGGARERLLAATPLLMGLQIALLPLFVWLMAGETMASSIDPVPFARAFVLLIAVPLGAAIAVQVLARRWRPAAAVPPAGEALMVPLMMLTLAVVVASQVHGVAGRLGELLRTIPLFVAFAAAMALLGVLSARVARLDRPRGRAVVFSGVTRNSLVVLPLALALPVGFELAALVVVTQTLVELIVLVTLSLIYHRSRIKRLREGH